MREISELERKVDSLAEDIREIRTALKYNSIGLIPTFEQHCNQDRAFRADYYKFKRTCILIFGILIGSGVLGTSIWQIFSP